MHNGQEVRIIAERVPLLSPRSIDSCYVTLDRSGPIRRMAVYEGKRGIASREPAKGPGAV